MSSTNTGPCGGFPSDPGGISGGHQGGKATIGLSNWPGAGKGLKLSMCSITTPVLITPVQRPLGQTFLCFKTQPAGEYPLKQSLTEEILDKSLGMQSMNLWVTLQTPNLKDPGRGTDVLNSPPVYLLATRIPAGSAPENPQAINPREHVLPPTNVSSSSIPTPAPLQAPVPDATN